MRSIKEIFKSYAVFDSEGRHTNGTDKQSNHNYGDAYEWLILDHFTTDVWKPHSGREAVNFMMEVGVADGSCLLAWREVFPNATIVGMDIHPCRYAAERYWDKNLEFHIGDQRSKDDCDRAAGGRMFDVIVEDATHILENSLLTLLYLWPYVRPGGVYVIEEFANIGALRNTITSLWPCAKVVDTTGPFGGTEPLVVFRKPIR